jgi:hypothetical protein
MPAEMTDRRFPPPWSVEEHDECFIVRDADGQALGYFYFDEEQQSPAIDRRLTRDDARRMAVNFAKLPDLVASSWLACKFACNSDPLRGDFRVQFRPLLTFCVSVLPCGPDGPGGTVGDGWRGQDRPGTTRLF